ncbi:Crp/Fnr family transcriptional regulator [Desulfonema magnum]|uniref:Cyclic nucleotide-binding domain-containing protein n=1 Tax=Desulfonema magnum TaxID=45655 RepID=A0A975BXV5_9BACT|nr:cyclic nucleotide-binding domain-containing protein [Desulfonema magnum]QTA93159.1 Cyclic nucleotide-binding domain-containing protein [Desulfonema magnum]
MPDPVPSFSVCRILKSLDIFSEISEEDLNALVSAAQAIELENGERVLAAGDICKSMYVVTEGRLSVCDGDTELTLLEKGSVFRKLAVLANEPCPYDITSVGETCLLRLDQKPLYDFMADHPQAARGVIRSLCHALNS